MKKSKPKPSVVLAVLTRDWFTKWLQDFNADEVVGLAALPCECPVSRFVQRQLPALEAVRTTRKRIYYRVAGKKTEYSTLPDWTSCFVDRVDTLRLGGCRHNGKEVTAEMALGCLNAIPSST